jgi:hypothetical protein
MTMRKTDAATRVVPTGRLDNAPAQLVCLALMLALVTLAWRILSVW